MEHSIHCSHNFFLPHGRTMSHDTNTVCVCVCGVCVCGVCVCVCGVCRGRDGGGVEDGGGAAAAYARREEERAKERRNHTTKRRKQSQFWDLAPRGFEHISPLQYKAMQGRDGLCSLVECGYMQTLLGVDR